MIDLRICCSPGTSGMGGGEATLSPRHCEERSDEAIQSPAHDSGLLRFARNDGERASRSVLLAPVLFLFLLRADAGNFLDRERGAAAFVGDVAVLLHDVA